MRPYKWLMIACLLFSGGEAYGGEFRSINPIPTLESPQDEIKKVENIEPIDRAVVERAVGKVIKAWNENNLYDVLGETFYDRERLVDAMADLVPRDSTLRILSIGGIQTLEQRIEPDLTGPTGAFSTLISTVSATVRTELSYNDTDGSFQRREGTSEYILKIKQKIAP